MQDQNVSKIGICINFIFILLNVLQNSHLSFLVLTEMTQWNNFYIFVSCLIIVCLWSVNCSQNGELFSVHCFIISKINYIQNMFIFSLILEINQPYIPDNNLFLARNWFYIDDENIKILLAPFYSRCNWSPAFTLMIKDKTYEFLSSRPNSLANATQLDNG